MNHNAKLVKLCDKTTVSIPKNLGDSSLVNTISLNLIDVDSELKCRYSFDKHNLYICLVCGICLSGLSDNSNTYNHFLLTNHLLYYSVDSDLGVNLLTQEYFNHSLLNLLKQNLKPTLSCGYTLMLEANKKKLMFVLNNKHKAKNFDTDLVLKNISFENKYCTLCEQPLTSCITAYLNQCENDNLPFHLDLVDNVVTCRTITKDSYFLGAPTLIGNTPKALTFRCALYILFHIWEVKHFVICFDKFNLIDDKMKEKHVITDLHFFFSKMSMHNLINKKISVNRLLNTVTYCGPKNFRAQKEVQPIDFLLYLLISIQNVLIILKASKLIGKKTSSIIKNSLFVNDKMFYIKLDYNELRPHLPTESQRLDLSTLLIHFLIARQLENISTKDYLLISFTDTFFNRQSFGVDLVQVIVNEKKLNWSTKISQSSTYNLRCSVNIYHKKNDNLGEQKKNDLLIYFKLDSLWLEISKNNTKIVESNKVTAFPPVLQLWRKY